MIWTGCVQADNYVEAAVLVAAHVQKCTLVTLPGSVHTRGQPAAAAAVRPANQASHSDKPLKVSGALN
jgi:hypothetical protein